MLCKCLENASTLSKTHFRMEARMKWQLQMERAGVTWTRTHRTTDMDVHWNSINRLKKKKYLKYQAEKKYNFLMTSVKFLIKHHLKT